MIIKTLYIKYIKNSMKRHIKKGDNVIVISGEDKGKKGKILEIVTEKNRALVEGVNIVSKHTKASNKVPQGGIVKKESPIHISNLMLVDPKTGIRTRVGRRENEKGKLVRYAKKSGQEV